MERKAKGYSTFKMKRSPFKVEPVSMAIAAGGKIAGSILGHKEKQEQEKLAAGRTKVEATKGLSNVGTGNRKSIA
jgi:hypothetical protein